MERVVHVLRGHRSLNCHAGDHDPRRTSADNLMRAETAPTAHHVRRMSEESMEATEAWKALTEQLTDDEQARASVSLALDAPARYFSEHRQALRDRGIEEADGLRPVIALVDALEGAGELAYLDWKSNPGTVVEELAGLPRLQRADVDLDPLLDLEGDLELALAHVNRLLKPADLAVIVIDEDSDAYPLVVIGRDRLSRVTDLAAEADAVVRIPEPAQHPIAEPAAEPIAESPAVGSSGPGESELRDPRQTVDHYRERLVARDIDAEIEVARNGMAMAVEHDMPELSASMISAHRALGQALSIRYALGTPVDDLVADVRRIGAVWAELDGVVGDRWQEPAWTDDRVSWRRNAESPINAVQAVSWAVSLNLPEVVEQVVNTYDVAEARLPIIGHLAAMVGVEAPTDGPASHAKLWQPWVDVVTADESERQAAFEAFVTGYPKGLRAVRRKVPTTDNGYPGQFAFEAAPLAIYFDLDDGPLRALPDYPADLVDYGRSLR